MKKALLLLNMGGPNNLDEVEVFLKNMFNDKNIISVKSDLLRSFIAFMIVTSRKKEARSNYEKLGGKSPLVGYTKKLVAKLQKALEEEFYVDFVMRYTPPFAKEVIQDLKQKGVTEIIALPLYPQFSTTTTKSSLEDLRAAIRQEGLDAKLSTFKRFYSHPLYNELLIDKLQEALQDEDEKEYDLIFSAHSLPQKIVDAGDPYQREVLLHVELLKDELKKRDLHFKDIHVAYQSKLGPVKWLEPSLEDKLKNLSNKKALICPISFTVDNSETEFELWIEYEEIAKELGFTSYKVARCPNDEEKFVKALVNIVTSK